MERREEGRRVEKINHYAAAGWFGQNKMVQKTWKIIESPAYEYSSESTEWELSNEYQHGWV